MDKIFSILPLLAEDAPGFGSNLVMMGSLVLIILIFYFLIIRPQNKAQKEKMKMLENLKKSDRIVTVGGIRGTVAEVKEKTIIVKVDDNVKLEFNRSAVAALINEETADTQ